MVAAPDALLGNKPELQGGAPVRTMQLQQANGAAEIAKDYQVLSQNAEAYRKVSQVVREGDGLPEPAEVLSARCPWPYAGEFRVLPGYLTVVITAVAGI
jgi:hypothetical protein